MSETWHGLTYQQWLKLWDAEGWREKVRQTLVDVATARGAAASDRLLALSSLNEAISEHAFAEDPGYPELMRDVLLEIQAGCKPPSKRSRKRYHDRLLGARWMLSTSYQFLAACPPVEEKPAETVDIPKYS